MHTRTAWTVMMVCALSAGVTAQDGLRSASLPERGTEATLAPPEDLFSVPPDFYSRRPDPHAPRLFFPPFIPALIMTPYPYVSPFGYLRLPHAAVSQTPASAPRRADVIPRSPENPGVAPAPSRPGVPKTFYVIPRCYAGDRLPQREWLRPGCDPAALRIVPPA